MERIIKELHGYSGSEIYLMENERGYFVRKIGDNRRNYERMTLLSNMVKLPRILGGDGHHNHLDMEYIPGLDVRTYLLHYNPDKLGEFIVDTLTTLAYNDGKKVSMKDYTETYINKLKMINLSPFPFTIDMLVDKLPKQLPKTEYHGDFTLDNMIFNTNEEEFYVIDPVTIDYDSYVFDIAKLNQDLRCGWFNRRTNLNLSSEIEKLNVVLNEAFSQYQNDYLNILMLLRIWPYCISLEDRNFIVKKVNELWIL